jgi:hypothetical protein
LNGPLPKWCPAVALSRQDCHHSAVPLLLKAALIQVSDYRLLDFVQIDCRCHGNGQNAKKLKNTKRIIAGYSPNI